ncbi:DUF1351 domain-containing protein [Dellaglioa algida]|uniref:DUF1351 domain-containing protein n=1 Tax=Dellaglioa algida TaxID=105612 RepID=UPI0024C4836F|nr:DUF1351 domain-containing protein [Dellaglioa algida]MDK1718691.1 DUF1351 domain-containing protein [Dellaglioa algida]
MVNELVSAEDLQFSVDFETSKITIANEDKLLKIANLYASRYADIVVSPETEKDVKKIRAEMKKVVKATDDKRKEIKREYNKPLAEFEQKVKAINTVINNVIDPIDKGLKELEESEREKRRDEVQEEVNEIALSCGISAEIVEIQSSWLNKSKSKLQRTKEIAFAVEQIFKEKDQINKDSETIKQFAATLNIDPDGWIEQIEYGSLVPDVMNKMTESVKRKQEAEELEKENQRKREESEKAIEALKVKTVNDTKVNVETGEIIPERPSIEQVTFTLQGTRDEINNIAKYISMSSIEVVDSSERVPVRSDQ